MPGLPRRTAVELFLVSFLILFCELTLIRWIAASVPSVAFFSNLVLIAAFVGMSLGCWAADGRRRWIAAAPILLLVLVATSGVAWSLYVGGKFRVGVRSPDRIFFGTVLPLKEFAGAVIPAEVVLGLIYVQIVALFVGFGQRLGQLLEGYGDRLRAYTTNIGGSLAGIGAFAVVSSLSLHPLWWFGAVGVLVLVCGWPESTRYRRVVGLVALGLTLAGVHVVAAGRGGVETHWSPYYRVDYVPRDVGGGRITVNGMGHQVMLPRERYRQYSLPYELARAAGLPPIERVLIIGAGSGNDVAHALDQGVTHVTAVEIDPTIYALGKREHPDRPYDDPRVTRVIDDGRAFLGRSTEQYDLIVYALVDSLTLHSSYSSVRLENYLFTEEAFRAVKARLAPGGLFCAYNYYREGWLIVRMEAMTREILGGPPLVISIPPKARITDTDSEGGNKTVLLAGEPAAKLRDAFGAEGTFRFQTGSVPEQLVPSAVVAFRDVEPTTDDWPFIYLRQRSIPAHNLRGLALILFLSGAFFVVLRRRGARRGNGWHFFWLGAGFMLIETVSITRLAALFGSTWVVSSLVFAAVLIMILGANLLCLRRPPRRPMVVYALLLVALGVGAWAPLTPLLALAIPLRLLAAGGLLALPILFAGIVFASSFRDSVDPAGDFGWNIAGVVAGALAESLSLVTGYGVLGWVIMACYVASWFRRPRSTGA